MESGHRSEIGSILQILQLPPDPGGDDGETVIDRLRCGTRFLEVRRSSLA
jgi:hypothetical protein